MECRLCCQDKELAESHIVPKMFYAFIKRNSQTGGIRRVDQPNRRVQDGLKLPFLCHECEELFSSYETFFSNDIFSKVSSTPAQFRLDTNNDKLRYFLLSVAWRTLKQNVETDKQMLSTFTSEENQKLEQVLENWRMYLLEKNSKSIRKIQMHFIPTFGLNIFSGFPEQIRNNVAIDFRVLGKENSFDYAFTYVKVPYFIFLCTVWGNTSHMKQFQVGKIVETKDSRLPSDMQNLISSHQQNFVAGLDKISKNQVDSIIKRANKSKSN